MKKIILEITGVTVLSKANQQTTQAGYPSGCTIENKVCRTDNDCRCPDRPGHPYTCSKRRPWDPHGVCFQS